MKNDSKSCGNKFCGRSTGIHEGLTFGSGECDANGYWEYPCRPCAEQWDATIEETKNDIRQRFADKEAAERYINEAEWLNLPAWPYAPREVPEQKQSRSLVHCPAD